jgi:hypothetical protein
MSYCILQDIRDLLPANITIGDNIVPSATAARANSIKTSVANKYIYFATQFIDSRLSQLYYVPLTKIKKVTVTLANNMLPSSTDVMVSDISGFNVDSAIQIVDDNGSEYAMVSNIPETFSVDGKIVKNFNHLTLSATTINAYDVGSHGVVNLLVYPDPIPVLTARLAASLMFDKLFVADQAPDVSNYGKNLRNMANNDMNGILSGQIRLYGQELCSKRFVRSSLFDAVKASIENFNPEQGMER